MKKFYFNAAFIFCLIFFAVAANAGSIRYVKMGATGDGSSWQSASGSVQDMINASAAGDEVWVAAGSYHPTTLIREDKSRSFAFMLKDGVSLYGGFAGTESSKDERVLFDSKMPWAWQYETILTADDDVTDVWERAYMDNTTYRYGWKVTGGTGVDAGVIPGTENNANHILYASDVISQQVVINGFTLKGGNANIWQVQAHGAALYAKGNVVLSGCKVIENQAWFKANSSDRDINTYGGAVYLVGDGKAEIRQCYFAKNFSHSSFGRSRGGAVYAKNVKISDCTFENNVSLDDGGAVFLDGGELTNSVISNCFAISGGALVNWGTSRNVKIMNCMGVTGGGVYNAGILESSIIANCLADATEWGDDKGGFGGGVLQESGVMVNCVVFNNQSFRGGGLYLKGGKVADCTIQHNRLRQVSDTANIGYDNREVLQAAVTNTVGNEKVDNSEFTRATTFDGRSANDTQVQEIENAYWRPVQTSSLIDTGTKTEGITLLNDIEGKVRIQGKAIDRGAYEYGDEVVVDDDATIVMTFVDSVKTATFSVGGSDGYPFQIDWGDGNRVEYTKASTFSEEIKGKAVKVYGEDVLLLLANQAGLSTLDVSKAKKLVYLRAFGNSLKTINLSNLNRLKDVRLNDNELEDLDISSNVALNRLYCHNNKIKYLDLSNNVNMQDIDCHNNQIEGLLDVSRMTNLFGLVCYANKIDDLKLGEHSLLKEFDCSENNITELNLGGLPELLEITCYDNKLKQLDFSANTKLEKVFAYDNKLTSINVNECKRLYTLSISNNEIATLDVSQNTMLDGLYANGNRLTQLDVTPHSRLGYLTVSGNKLTTLDLTHNNALKILKAEDNLLTEIDLKANTQLTSLHIGNNKLSAIDVTPLTSLSWLKVNQNMLTTIDISKNTVLSWLECGNNKLTNLDISTNKHLIQLNAPYNQLTAIDNSNNPDLKGILLQGNLLTLASVNAMIGHLADVNDYEINDNNREWGKQLNLDEMPQIASANVDEAKQKGWIVTIAVPDAIETTSKDSKIVKIEYYLVNGMPVTKPQMNGGVYIVKKQFEDGSTQTSKVVMAP